jgi:WD40 repeat protein/predicted Ser/Thr protein kinase
MTQAASCPDSAELKSLLDGTLPETKQAEVNSHLETCSYCQERLQGLVAGKESWSGTAEQLSRQEQEPNADLERIMEQMKKEGQGETEVPPADEVTLEFLDPSENPEHLGRLGHYEILEVLGRGGMGVVLKAFDSALHRVVAIKVLAPQLATSLAARKRFEREARAVAAISHEHIVAIYAVEETKGLPYLVMEYVAGVSLQDRLDRSGAQELKEILRIGMQAAKGLAAAHAQGLVHRDIKPANILLHNGVERVKITDFGLARAMDDASVTQSGYVAGTPQYMAPEQARGEAIDHRADLFSLGSVLYALAAGRPPFRGSTAMAVLRRVSEENPQPLAEINSDIPLWLAEIIAKLHAKNPAERFQSAQEVAEVLGERLAQLQRTGDTEGQRTEPRPSRTARSAPGARRCRWIKAAALFVPLIACGLVLTEATGLTQIKQWVATVLRISTSQGTLIVEIDDPKVRVTIDGEELAIHGAGLQEIRVKPGEHRIQAMKDGKPVPVDRDLVTISRGGKQIVRVRQESAKPEVVKQGQPVSEVPSQGKPIGHLFNEVRSLAFSPDGNTLVGTSESPGPNARGEIRLWGVIRQPGKQDSFVRWGVTSRGSQDLFFRWPILSAAFSPGGQTFATAEGDGTAKLRDPASGQEITAFGGADKTLGSVAFAPDGESLAAGSDGVVRIWRLLTRELLVTLGTANRASYLTFSLDGKTLAVGGKDFRKGDGSDNVELFGVSSRRVRTTLDLPPKVRVSSIAFSPDSKMLATANSDETVRFWDATNGRLLHTLHTGSVHCAVFSPDGRLLASGGDNVVKLWDIATRQELTALQGIGWLRVGALAFSPDGKLLASGSADRYVRMWDVGAALATAKSEIKVTVILVQRAEPMKLAESVRVRLGDAASKVKIEIHPRRKELVILANAELTKRVKEMISQLDKEQVVEIEVQHPKQVEATPVQHYTGRLARPPGDPIGMTFDMDERSFLEYQALMRQQKGYGPGSPIYVGLLNEKGYPHQGTITGFNDTLDPNNGTMQVYSKMPNPGRLLLPGLSVRVEMPFGPPQKVFALPSQAVLQDSGFSRLPSNSHPAGEYYVLVVNDKDIVEHRVVKPVIGGFVVHEKDRSGKEILDFQAQARMHAIEKGLNSSDWVVVGTSAKYVVRRTGAAFWLPPGTHVKPRIVEEKTTETGPPAERATLQQRVAKLQEIAAAKERLFDVGRLTIQEFLPAKLAVLNAKLELAESDKERIAIHEKIVAYSKEIEQAIDRLYQIGRITKPELLKAEQKRLEAEAALEQAKAKAATQHSK